MADPTARLRDTAQAMSNENVEVVRRSLDAYARATWWGCRRTLVACRLRARRDRDRSAAGRRVTGASTRRCALFAGLLRGVPGDRVLRRPLRSSSVPLARSSLPVEAHSGAEGAIELLVGSQLPRLRRRPGKPCASAFTRNGAEALEAQARRGSRLAGPLVASVNQGRLELPVSPPGPTENDIPGRPRGADSTLDLTVFLLLLSAVAHAETSARGASLSR